MTLIKRIATEKRVALAVVAGLVLATVLLYGIGVYPQRSGVATTQTRARVAFDDLAEARRSLGDTRAHVNGTTHADEELEQFYGRVLPQDLAGARSITYPRLAALASEMGLLLERRTTERDQDEESELGRLRTTMSLAGEYASIRRFIEALETAPEFLVIEEIVLSQREDVDDAFLVLTLGVSTYYRNEDGASS